MNPRITFFPHCGLHNWSQFCIFLSPGNNNINKDEPGSVGICLRVLQWTVLVALMLSSCLNSTDNSLPSLPPNHTPYDQTPKVSQWIAAPHVDVKGVHAVDVEAARPTAAGVIQDADTQQLVKVNPRPMEGQLALRQCRQTLLRGRPCSLLHTDTKPSCQASSPASVTAHKI